MAGIDKEKLTILLPTLNEVSGIGKVISDIPLSSIKDLDISIVVTDGGSTDGTQQVVLDHNCKLYQCSEKGKGNQVAAALADIKTDYLIMLDSDGTYPPKYIVPMAKTLRLGLCDVIIGYRIYNSHSMSKLHALGNFGLTSLANLLYSTKIADLCTGYWGFNRKALSLINITATGFELEANLFCEIVKNKLKLGQMPIEYLPRIGKGHLKFTHGFTIAKKLITERIK